MRLCAAMLALETPHGPANAHLHRVDEPRAALVLGHGAGGGVTAPDQGDHSLRTDPDAIAAAAREWLGGVLGPATNPLAAGR